MLLQQRGGLCKHIFQLLIIPFFFFGQPFVKRFALCYRTVDLPVSVLSVCDVGVLWPNGWMDEDETLA